MYWGRREGKKNRFQINCLLPTHLSHEFSGAPGTDRIVPFPSTCLYKKGFGRDWVLLPLAQVAGTGDWQQRKLYPLPWLYIGVAGRHSVSTSSPTNCKKIRRLMEFKRNKNPFEALSEATMYFLGEHDKRLGFCPQWCAKRARG